MRACVPNFVIMAWANVYIARESFLTMAFNSWGRVTHICVSKFTTIVSDNGLSPGRLQAIIWTSDGILLIWPLGTNFSEIFIEIHTFSFMKIHIEMSSGKWRPFCLGLNVWIHCGLYKMVIFRRRHWFGLIYFFMNPIESKSAWAHLKAFAEKKTISGYMCQIQCYINFRPPCFNHKYGCHIINQR